MRRPRAQDREDGTITLLTIGMFGIALALVVTVIDISAVYLARRDLAGECDSAALAASQAVDPATIYGSGIGTSLPVTAAAGSAAATAVARTVGAATTTVTTVAGGQVTVACTRKATLPVGSLIGVGTVIIKAGASAESPVR